jgi:hypothetical protein
MRRPLLKRRIDRHASEVDIRLALPGMELSRRLQIQTSLVLARPAANRSGISPGSAGARLWQDVEDIALEGDASRFPMESVSFRKVFPGTGREDALWFLHWQPSSLHADFLGAVRLYVNSDQTEFLERFRTGEPLIMRIVLASVMSEMASTILALDDGPEVLGDAEPSSVAGRVASWIGLSFPGAGFATVRERMRSRPGEFHSALQAIARTGG